jgi:hypothetical protein
MAVKKRTYSNGALLSDVLVELVFDPLSNVPRVWSRASEIDAGEDEVDAMSTAEALKIAEINQGDQAFAKLVTNQASRVTQELVKLEQLMKAGMVDPAVLKEFRKAVDDVRKTSWAVEQSLASHKPTT